MKNLVEQASQWLQSETCRSGNILERTIAVVACFRKYVVEEKTEICDNTGLSLSTIMDASNEVCGVESWIPYV